MLGSPTKQGQRQRLPGLIDLPGLDSFPHPGEAKELRLRLSAGTPAFRIFTASSGRSCKRPCVHIWRAGLAGPAVLAF